MNMASALLSIQAMLTAAVPDDPQVVLCFIFLYVGWCCS